MVEIEIQKTESKIILKATIVTYGDAATAVLTERIRSEIETMWNEPEGLVSIENQDFQVEFQIQSQYNPALTQLEVISNTNSQLNYFRIESFSPINISWVDGVGSNTGYFLLDNLYEGSTTAAHEFGHSIGLDHPADLNYIGKGVPSIMYPRGTLVDRAFQYDPAKNPGEVGGTMHPIYRKVNQANIDLLQIPKNIADGKTYLGAFTSSYHDRIYPTQAPQENNIA